MILSVALSLASLQIWAPLGLVEAGNVTYGGTCNITHNRLSAGTKQFMSDCTATTYCASNNTCLHKGCRRDEYPFGYKLFSHIIPPRCPKGQFCPDEGDACQPLLPVGSLCQLNRDDECQPPPDHAALAGPNNFNGSVCLNFVCMWANATLGNECVVENIAYVGYEAASGAQFLDVVSRGNCVNGLYCDSVSLTCKAQAAMGQTCDADKECETYNCLQSGVCGARADSPKLLPIGVYVGVSICIIGVMVGTLTGLYILHRGHRHDEREKRAQYWREQEQFRQNIMQMREQARTSLLSLPWQSQPTSPRHATNEFSRDYPASEHSQTPMLHAASQPSGLRNEFSDNGYEDTIADKDSGEESLVIGPTPKGHDGRKAGRRF